MTTVSAMILGAYAAMSAATFILFTLDKRAASRARRRVPERTLHLMELLGGWPGTLLGMRLIRHKNRKGRYLLILGLIIGLHAACWAFAGWNWFLR